MINFKIIVLNHILCSIIEHITYDILQRRLSGRITVYEIAIEIHHNDTIVFFLKKKRVFLKLLYILKKKIYIYLQLGAGHHQERSCNVCKH